MTTREPHLPPRAVPPTAATSSAAMRSHQASVTPECGTNRTCGSILEAVLEPLEALKRVPLLSGLKSRDLKRLAKIMSPRHFEAGETAVVQGKSGIGFFLILEGTAAVDVGGEDVRRLGPGDYFGEMALIDEGARTATVTAESELECLAMTAWNFKPWAEQRPEVTWAMLETTIKRLREAERR
jgi:CRP/FNR family transcriptional regulator, cyclic AMP receptor protein